MSLYLSETSLKPEQPETMLSTGTGLPYSRLYLGSPSTGPVLYFDNVCLDDVPIRDDPAY